MTTTLPIPSVEASGECEVRLMHPDVVARVEANLPSPQEVESASSSSPTPPATAC